MRKQQPLSAKEQYQPQQKMRRRAMIIIQMQLLSKRLQRQLFIKKSSEICLRAVMLYANIIWRRDRNGYTSKKLKIRYQIGQSDTKKAFKIMQSHISSFLCKKILNLLVKFDKVCYNLCAIKWQILFGGIKDERITVCWT